MSLINDNIKKTIEEYKKKVKEKANSHQAKLVVFSDLLKDLFDVQLEDLLPGIEKKLKSSALGLGGRADLMFSNVVFEMKMDLDKELEKAKEQLKKYLQALYEQDPNSKNIGIATDGIEFKAYVPIIKNNQVSNLKEIGSMDLDEVSPPDAFYWLDSFIFSKREVKPTAQNLKYRFGPGSPTYSLAIDSLRSLWNEVKNESDVKLKFELWKRYMEIVYGSAPEENSFVDHTYLVTLVKLIIYLKLSGDNTITMKDIEKALTGEYFASYGIENLIEEDFFAWILHPKISDRAVELFQRIARELLKYDLSEIDEDLFKEIYQEIVKREQRSKTGEYYTPEWLAELTLREAIKVWKERKNERLPRILDPACGSGTFLCNAIHIIREELEKQGKKPWEILNFILDNIVGIDINSLAVTIARANYLLALGDLLRKREQRESSIIIPVYVADSIKIPEEIFALGGTAYGIPISISGTNYHNIENEKKIIIPKSIVADRKKLSKVLRSLKEAVDEYKKYEIKDRKSKDMVIQAFGSKLLGQLNSGELVILKKSLDVIMDLVDKGQDSVWLFVLSNIYAPIMLMESKFDVIVGNPPWISLRDIGNKEYQDFIKEQILKKYRLLDSKQTHLFTHMEIATLFFYRCSDLYLRDGGVIAFVLPRTVIEGAQHHINFRQFRVQDKNEKVHAKELIMKLDRIYDLEKVEPLFNVPTCVLIAIKGEETSYPVPKIRYSGALPEKNIKLRGALSYLLAEEHRYIPHELQSTYKSHYFEHFKEGATIVPRSFFFIEFKPHSILGIDPSKPLVRTSEEVIKNAKEPWKDIRLEGNIESEFIYASLLGGDILPFGYTELRPIVLPAESSNEDYRLLDVDELRRRRYTHMASWLEKAQRYWEERRTEKSRENFPKVIDRLDYQRLLTSQNPKKRYCVVFTSGGKNIASCVIDKQALPAFKVGEVEIKPKNFIVESSAYFYYVDDENEAHYLCAVLNSNVVNDYIKPFQPKGRHGERSIKRRPLELLPIPQFDPNNQIHRRLAELSKQCHEKVAKLRPTLTKKSIGTLRNKAKEVLKNEIEEIDELVGRLLKT